VAYKLSDRKRYVCFYRKHGKKSKFFILKEKKIGLTAFFTAIPVKHTEIIFSFYQMGSRQNSN